MQTSEARSIAPLCKARKFNHVIQDMYHTSQILIRDPVQEADCKRLALKGCEDESES
jgi:hypothetical protein